MPLAYPGVASDDDAAAANTMIADLADLDLADLRAVWQAHWGDCPPLRSPGLLRLLIAWRLQAAVHGDLDRDTRRALARHGDGEAEGLHLGVGARLSRVWQGREEVVVVENKGFRWRGRLFPSLSAAATAIAGSRWNGPRFFGLRDAQAEPRRRAARPAGNTSLSAVSGQARDRVQRAIGDAAPAGQTPSGAMGATA